MQGDTTVRFRVDLELRRLLDRLRDEKDINDKPDRSGVLR